MEPQEVHQLLSEYFTEMTDTLFKYKRTLDKFMGNAIMAFFGNPVPQPDQATRGVLMSLEMQDTIVTLNQKLTAEGRRMIGVGMGINTGRRNGRQSWLKRLPGLHGHRRCGEPGLSAGAKRQGRRDHCHAGDL